MAPDGNKAVETHEVFRCSLLAARRPLCLMLEHGASMLEACGHLRSSDGVTVLHVGARHAAVSGPEHTHAMPVTVTVLADLGVQALQLVQVTGILLSGVLP